MILLYILFYYIFNLLLYDFPTYKMYHISFILIIFQSPDFVMKQKYEISK
jgi:hypothetical protein